MTTAQDGGKVVTLTHRLPLPQAVLLVLISVRDWVDPGPIVRSEWFYINGKFHWQQLESNKRPSDLQHSTLPTVLPRSPKFCCGIPIFFVGEEAESSESDVPKSVPSIRARISRSAFQINLPSWCWRILIGRNVYFAVLNWPNLTF